MKYLIVFSLLLNVAHAGECKLTGITQSCQKYETKFDLQNIEDCTSLAKKTHKNKFFNFIEKDDQLVRTNVTFKEEAVQEDEIEFSQSNC
ncbi:hypothetical protein [Peredibacter starrii]|uniref:Uncharacterized protein n=1 Tax=Peredibacter starrii TaxID=28202 RepID=A0AAX4HL38_9BACT|nr:hypothetical protein [Peredibacter starrii]WPU63941.1 hypothetical protein SOO65_14695 [Peredibacter starrii]